MTRTAVALVKPELLIWARKTARYHVEDVAHKISVSEESLRKWEAGESQPSMAQLREMAKVYQRPLPVFYLPKAPPIPKAVEDFRRLPEGGSAEVSPALELQVRRARERRELAVELAEELDEDVQGAAITAEQAEDPDLLAERLRAHLGVSLEEQFGWRDKYMALSRWKAAVERVGILVFQADSRVELPVEQMRGVSIAERPLPAIILNGKDSPAGRVFTLLHELVHIALHEGGICDLNDSAARRPHESNVEVFCNRVAGAVLVPDEALRHEPVVVAQRDRRFSDDEIATLADKYSVSAEVIWRRLVIIGRITDAVYRAKRPELQQRRPSKPGARIPVFRRVLNTNGLRFTSLVLNAYNEEKLSVGDVSSYLGMRLKHLDDLEQAVFVASQRARK